MKAARYLITPLGVALACLTRAGFAQETPAPVPPPGDALLGEAPYRTGFALSSAKTKYRESVPPVVIQFATSDRSTVEAMEEDLAVMTRIIEKALDGGLGEEQAMGIPLLVSRGGRSVRALHIEGLGALFMIKVDFPLLPPPKTQEKKAEAAATSEWESAKKELDGLDARTEERWGTAMAGGGEYDEEQVEAMKKTLLLALKQASNMKHLKADDSVIVSVFGSPNSGLASTSSGTRKGALGGGFGGGFGGSGGGGGGFGGGGFGGLDGTKSKNPGVAPPAPKAPKPAAPDAVEDPNVPALPPPPAPPLKAGRARATGGAAQEIWTSDGRVISRISGPNRRAVGQGTVVTLRVKKADVDAFAKGTLSFEAFQQRATVNAYVGSGQGITSVNSWIGLR